MKKSSGMHRKLEDFSYQLTSKGGNTEKMLKSLREVHDWLGKMERKQKK